MRPGESVVVHAGAGGVGSLAVQLARQWGAGRVIATASTPDKRDLATGSAPTSPSTSPRTARRRTVEQALRAANEGRRVDVVLEMTGGVVFDGSLQALAPMGRLVCYGMASQTPPSPVDPRRLMAASATVSGFWLVHAIRLAVGWGLRWRSCCRWSGPVG